MAPRRTGSWPAARTCSRRECARANRAGARTTTGNTCRSRLVGGANRRTIRATIWRAGRECARPTGNERASWAIVVRGGSGAVINGRASTKRPQRAAPFFHIWPRTASRDSHSSGPLKLGRKRAGAQSQWRPRAEWLGASGWARVARRAPPPVSREFDLQLDFIHALADEHKPEVGRQINKANK